METNILAQAVLVLALGVGSQWIAALLRLPSILLLLLAGFIAGPVTGLLHPEQLLPGHDLLPALVSLSVALILFEGGLTLRIAEVRQVGGVVGRLVTLGVLVNWVIGTAAAHWILGLPFDMAILLGAILVLSGPTVVAPLLRMMRPRGPASAILKWEGIVIDPVGALLATLVFQTLQSTDIAASFGSSGWAVLRAVFVGGALGMVAALALQQLLMRHWIPDLLQAPFTLATVASAFAVSNHFQHESGLLAVTVMGFYLTNQRKFSIQHITRFKEHLTILLIACLFVLLAALVEPRRVLDLLWPRGLLFLAVLIFVARPACVWISARGSGLALRDKIFLAALFPRGIVAAAVAPLFALRLEGVEGAAKLVPLTYLVIVGTVAFYGLTSPLLARRLGITQPNPQGVLFVGANKFIRDLAAAIKSSGFEVLLVDTNRTNVAECRMAGLPARHTNILAEDAFDELDLGGLGCLLAMTPNDEVNALAAVHGSEVFARPKVFQLARESERTSGSEVLAGHLRGRTAFGKEITFQAIADQFRAGAVVKKTNLTDDFDIESFRELYGDEAMILFKIAADHLHLVTSQEPGQFASESTLIAVVKPED